MATAPAEQQLVRDESAIASIGCPADAATAIDHGAAADRPAHSRDTSQLKVVPETNALREQIRTSAIEVVARLDKSSPLGKHDLETLARDVLGSLKLSEGYLGWTMVALVTAFNRDQVAAVPISRRLLLLPACDEHGEHCPTSGCQLSEVRGETAALGYQVIMADAAPAVLKIAVTGQIDAIVGVASLDVLEHALDKILLAGIPCMAVPLLSGDRPSRQLDRDWVEELIRTAHRPAAVVTRSYVHLMRAAAAMFTPAELHRLAPRMRTGGALAELNGHGVSRLDPVAGTEALAYDFLARGGKHSRPFITLAVYDALTGGHGTRAGAATHVAALPMAVRRTALSIETFHKASLVHDDIEDDDRYRYGVETMHRKYGTATAINVGDYLIGLGYRLVSRESQALGPAVVSDILDRLAEAHMRLSEGQGAELLWRDAHHKQLHVADALQIYALKTAPAFEAALYAGARLAGPAEKYAEPIAEFARNLGIAFQVLNDLDDWQGDSHNKLLAGGDVLGGRPTVLWALALEALPATQCDRLHTLVGQADGGVSAIEEVRRLYEAAGVFEKAAHLVDQYEQRAAQVAAALEPVELGRLFYYLINTVLDRGAARCPVARAAVAR